MANNLIPIVLFVISLKNCFNLTLNSLFSYHINYSRFIETAFILPFLSCIKYICTITTKNAAKYMLSFLLNDLQQTQGLY